MEEKSIGVEKMRKGRYGREEATRKERGREEWVIHVTL